MKRYLFCSVAAFFVLITLANANEVTKAKIFESYGKIPLSFTANEGQFDSQVKFRSSGNGTIMFFTQEGTTFLLSRKVQKSLTERMLLALKQSLRNLFSFEPYEPLKKEELQREREYYALKLRFVNSNPNPEMIGEEMLAGNTNYFIGNNPEKWRTDISNYGKVRLRNLFDGIDLVYYGNNNKMKYDFVIQPGIDPNQILLVYDFGNNPFDRGSMAVNDNGELMVKTPFGDLIERRPYAYQIINGKTKEVNIKYAIINKELGKFTFKTDSYDTNFPLIIDPELSISTFIGGNNYERGQGIAIDKTGNIYVSGVTVSTNFPTTAGAIDTMYNGGSTDLFVFKMNASGNALFYSTFIGGSGYDPGGYGIAIDDSGNATVIAETESNNFPVTPGAYDTSYNSSTDVVIFKINSLGNSLLYSTYLGGSGVDESTDLVLDNNGNSYITGLTKSANFPKSSGTYDSTYNGGDNDAFITKLNSSGSALLFSTYLGSGGDDRGYGIAVDNNGDLYVTGTTTSSSFPTTPGSYDVNFGGVFDAFICKFNSSGTSLLYSTYLGGSDDDCAWAIKVGSGGQACVAGYTLSNDFPTLNAYDNTNNGGWDLFVCELNSSGSALSYSTYLGGSGDEKDPSIAISGTNKYITALTSSTNFPTTPNALDRNLSGSYDAVVSIFSFNWVKYSTYLGGSGDENGVDITNDVSGNVYITGSTGSSDFPVKSGGYDLSYNGGSADVFLSRISFKDSLIVRITDTLLVGQKNFPCDTVLIPIFLRTFDADYGHYNGIYSFQTTITYDDSKFQCLGYDTVGTWITNSGGLSPFTVQFRKDSGTGSTLDTIRLAGAGNDSLSYYGGGGRLINLKFRIPTIAHNGDSTILHFTRFMFNEGTPASSTDDGSIKLKLRKKGDVDKNGVIQPIDAILVLRYVIHDTTLDAESQIAAEVSNNGEITAYDAALILMYWVGKITSFPAGTYYKQALPSNKGVDITMEWGEVKDGMVSLLVKAKNLSEVYGYSLALSYDPSVLTYQGYQSSDLTKRMTAVVRNENGQLRMAVAGVDPLNGEGEIVAFKFKLNSNGDFNRDKLVNLNELVLNEEIIISNVTISSLPKTYSLDQNYPNPFNPETRIRYQILEVRQVQLIVYNLLGQPVRTLVNEMKPAGVYEVRWDGRNDQGINLASGVYIYRIKAGNFVSTRKLILMK